MTNSIAGLIDVLICTYRRPELLLKTLDGIQRCAESVERVRIIVVDNDVQQSARKATQEWSQHSSIHVLYLTQPEQNISLTRNMALEHATAPWLALIDDDEVPDENWLRALLDSAAQYDADVVFAPVISEFDTDAPAWARKGSLYQRKRFPTGTVIPLKEMRTGNALIRSSRLMHENMRFDPALGLSGGGDSEFFSRLAKENYRMVWCDEACVREWTPLSRTTLSWILRRGFRIGSVDAYNKLRFGHYQQAAISGLKSSVFVAQGGLQALFWAPVSSPRSVQGLRKAAMGVGYFYGLVAGPYLEYCAPTVKKEKPV